MKQSFWFVLILTFTLAGTIFAVRTWHQRAPQELSNTLKHLSPASTSTVLSIEDLQRQYVVYGYVPYWTAKTTTLSPELTHASYFSLPIASNGALFASSPDNVGLTHFKKGILDDLRSRLGRDQKLEITFSMLEQEAIEPYLRDSTRWQQTLTDMTTLLQSNAVSGINIDIEYNGEVDRNLQESFAQFVTQVAQHGRSIIPHLHISVAMYADSATVKRITDPKLVAGVSDHLIIMAYDFHRRSSPQSGPVAPLFGGRNTKWAMDITETLSEFTKQVDADKIVLGVPFYGYEWGVTNHEDPQSFTLPKTGVTATFNRIMQLLQQPNVVRKFDSVALSPYIEYVEGSTLKRIYYDDAESLQYKLELVKQTGLAGIAIWAIGYEGDSNAFWDVIGNELH